MRVNRENKIMHLPDAAWRIAYFNLCVKEDVNKEKKKKVKEKKKAFRVGQRRVETRL